MYGGQTVLADMSGQLNQPFYLRRGSNLFSAFGTANRLLVERIDVRGGEGCSFAGWVKQTMQNQKRAIGFAPLALSAWGFVAVGLGYSNPILVVGIVLISLIGIPKIFSSRSCSDSFTTLFTRGFKPWNQNMKLSDITKQYKQSELSADKGIEALNKEIKKLESYKEKKAQGNKKLVAMKTALDQGIRNVEGVTYTGDAKNHDKQFASLLLHALPSRAAISVAKAYLKSTLDEESTIMISNEKREIIAKKPEAEVEKASDFIFSEGWVMGLGLAPGRVAMPWII
jgi:hypothetical protein